MSDSCDPRTVALQISLSMRFQRQKYWSVLPFELHLQQAPTGPAPLLISCPEKSLPGYSLSVFFKMYSLSRSFLFFFLQHVMFFYFKEGKNVTETQKKICVVYREGAATDQMCQKWFVKFYAGDFSLDNAPWSGRPVEIDSDQIETLRKISVIPKWMLFKAVDAVHQGKAFASLDNLSGYYLQF